MESVKNFQNIDSEDFVGMYHSEEILVKEGETRAFTGKIAKHIAGQLATKILIREGKDYLGDVSRPDLINQMLGEVVAPKEVEKISVEEKVKAEEPKEFEELKVKKPAKPRKRAK